MDTDKKVAAHTEDQDNMGYENTTTRNNQDDLENDRLETTDTGHSEGPEENKDDSAGLRSESGKKSRASESDNLERG
jgi:hypothetical protein